MERERFDALSEVYDGLIDWPKRLAREGQFLREVFAEAGVRRVLDVACGTGRHAEMFHSWGMEVEGADVSGEMIARCRTRVGEPEGLRWVVRGFEEPVEGRFDAVVCVGNSLALAGDRAAAGRVVKNMVRAVREGGVVIVQVLNLWRLADGPCVWQVCKRVVLGGREQLVLKGVHRCGDAGWVEIAAMGLEERPEVAGESVRFTGLEADELMAAAREAGAMRVECFGDYGRNRYERARSGDLVVVGVKGEGTKEQRD